MNEFFQSIQSFIAAVEARAQDAAAQGADALRRLAEYIESQSHSPVAAAASHDDTQIDECLAKLSACEASCAGEPDGKAVPVKGKAVVGFSGAGLALLFQVLSAVLEALKTPPEQERGS